jgi:hypothetical protein
LELERFSSREDAETAEEKFGRQGPKRGSTKAADKACDKDRIAPCGGRGAVEVCFDTLEAALDGRTQRDEEWQAADNGMNMDFEQEDFFRLVVQLGARPPKLEHAT